MKTFRDRMKEHGANSAQLESGTARMAEDIIAEMSSEEIEEFGTEYIGNSISTLKRLLENAETAQMEARVFTRELHNTNEKAREVLKDMYDKIDTLKIEATEETKQATLIFANVLMQTKEIFGDNLSDEVMKAAIEAGSYGMWRNLMGGKYPNERR